VRRTPSIIDAIAALLRTLTEEERAAIRVLIDPGDRMHAIVALLRTLNEEDLAVVLDQVPTRDTYPMWPG